MASHDAWSKACKQRDILQRKLWSLTRSFQKGERPYVDVEHAQRKFLAAEQKLIDMAREDK